MRILVLGTGPFAVPTFAQLLTSSHEVPALITRPEVPGKGRKPIVQPMREFAEQHQIPVHAPQDINSPAGIELLQSLAGDLLMVCDYGQILSNAALSTAPLGGINLHGSLLPKYRGAAPINWAVWKGERETGVTVIHMTPLLDGGPAIAVRSTPIGPTETVADLEPRLAQLGVSAVMEAVEKLSTWDKKSPIGIVQDQSLATKARRLRKSDGDLLWDRSAEQILNQVRALKPWPATFTFWHRSSGEPLRLVIDDVSISQLTRPENAVAGEVLQATGQGLEVAAGEGVVTIQRVQPAGKKVMPVADFLRGYSVQPGDRLGAETKEIS